MSYNPAFDGLRALSVLAVVLFHCKLPYFGGGFAGLDVFFVLSGYLITSMLEREHRQGGIGVGRFYARRALRLYPTLLLMLVAYMALAPTLWPQENRWLASGIAVLYLWDYAISMLRLSSVVAHTWSLGTEEKFYLLWPLLLPLVLRARRPVVWLVAAYLLVTAWRAIVALEWGWVAAYFDFDTRMSGILLGAIAALTRYRVRGHLVAIACVALVTCIALPSLPHTDQVRAVTLSITLAELSAFVLVCHAARQSRTPILSARPLAYVGRLSYGLYIWHFPATSLLAGSPLWTKTAWVLLFSFVMAVLCLHLVDLPIKRWRERRGWSPSAVRPVVQAGP